MVRKRPTITIERYLNGDHFDFNSYSQVVSIIVHDFSLIFIESYNEKAAERG